MAVHKFVLVEALQKRDEIGHGLTATYRVAKPINNRLFVVNLGIRYLVKLLLDEAKFLEVLRVFAVVRYHFCDVFMHLLRHRVRIV